MADDTTVHRSDVGRGRRLWTAIPEGGVGDARVVGNPRGRPPIDPARRCTVMVKVRMPPRELTQARQCAQARGVSLPAIVRAGLRRFVAAELPRVAETVRIRETGE